MGGSSLYFDIINENCRSLNRKHLLLGNLVTILENMNVDPNGSIVKTRIA